MTTLEDARTWHDPCYLRCVGLGCASSRGSPQLWRSAHQRAETTCSSCHGASGHSISPTFPDPAGRPLHICKPNCTRFAIKREATPTHSRICGAWRRSLAMQRSRPLLPTMPSRHHRGPRLAMKSSWPAASRSSKKVSCEDWLYATCHGPQARGNNIFPRLAAQHADYLVKQALVIQRGLRGWNQAHHADESAGLAPQDRPSGFVPHCVV